MNGSSATVFSVSRFMPRSSPTNCSTNSLAGSRSSSSGVAYCSRIPPTFSRAIRSASRIASSMSWVTNTIVLWTCSWRAQQLVLEAAPHDRVDRAERLVHQQDRRVGGQRARHADPLLLAARQLVGVAVEHRRLEPDQLEPARRPGPAMRCLVPARAVRGTVRDVLPDGAVREQPDLLDDVADAAAQLGDRLVRDVLAVDARVDPRSVRSAG